MAHALQKLHDQLCAKLDRQTVALESTTQQIADIRVVIDAKTK